MKFDDLLKRLLILEGDIKPKEIFWQHAPSPKEPTLQTVVGSDPSGPIIISGTIAAKKLNQVIQTQQFTDEFLKGPDISQNLLRQLINQWLSGENSIKSEHKHGLRGGGFIWDANSKHPSIKVRFDIDGKNRILIFRNVWWSYNEYERQFTA